MDPVVVIGWLAALFATILGIPQAVRLIRTREIDGISLLAWQSVLVINLTWAHHGALIGQLNMALPNGLAMTSTLPVLVLVARGRGLSLVRVLVPPLLASGGLIFIDRVWGTALFGVIAIIPAVVATSGQSLDLVRSESVEGVSVVYLVAQVINQALWFSWATMIFELGSLITSSTTGVIALFNLGWWLARRAGVPAYWAPERTPSAQALLDA